MDQLATEGVRFNTAWAAPSCSPGRSTTMTGRFGFRTDLGAVIRGKESDPGLLLEETCIAEALKVDRPDL